MKQQKLVHNKRVRTGDMVVVTSGNDRGLVGEVLSRTTEFVIVKGVNVRKKHVKRTQDNPTGGIVEIERPIHLSNVALCVNEQSPRKLRIVYDNEGGRQLVYREGDSDVPFRSIKTGKA